MILNNKIFFTVSLPQRYISFARIILSFPRLGGLQPPSPPAPYADANQFASFCINNRSRQNAFFVSVKVAKFEIKRLFFTYILILYYIVQIDSMLPCDCSEKDHRGRQNVIRTSVTHLAAPRVPLFCSYHMLTSPMTYYWTDAGQHGIYLLICCPT